MSFVLSVNVCWAVVLGINWKHRIFAELCAGRKLKSFLEEPAARLPQYLQHLAAVYEAFEAEEHGRDSNARRTLFQAIVDIKAVTDEIAVKCRDLKARLLVGALQKDVFGNKIQLVCYLATRCTCDCRKFSCNFASFAEAMI